MSNPHFGKLADVWKHLVLDEALTAARPVRYAETHAGSGAYTMVDDAERRYGALGFLAGSSSPPLDNAAFTRVVSGFVGRRPPLYPGSALQAMTLLGDRCSYLLCDTDPASANDLRRWADDLGLDRCEVTPRDGLSAVHGWLPDRTATVVHIDPFDPFAPGATGVSAIDLAAQVAEAGHLLVYWYGYDSDHQRGWAFDEIRSRTDATLWCGDLLVQSLTTGRHGRGNLGEATTPGTGTGVVLANPSRTLVETCQALAEALAHAYQGRPLPSGEPGRLDLSVTCAT
jgi:23S rRNA A2030 N6-methylase RlmJ